MQNIDNKNVSEPVDEFPDYIGNRYVFGSSYIVLCSTLMILQALTFYVFLNKRMHEKNTAFKLIFHINVVSTFEQIAHFISGFYIIFHFNNDNAFGTFIGSLLQSAYMTAVALVTLLTINRFDVLYSNQILPQMNREKFYKVSFILCYVYYFFFLILSNIPSQRIYFNLKLFTWMFYREKQGLALGYLIESNCNFVLLIVSFLLYIAIIGKIFYLRGLTSSGKIIKLEDIKLFLQAIFNYLIILILELCWGNWSYLFRDQTQVVIIVNFLFILVSGNNTILGIILITDIRRGIKNIFIKKSKVQEQNIKLSQMKNNFSVKKSDK